MGMDRELRCDLCGGVIRHVYAHLRDEDAPDSSVAVCGRCWLERRKDAVPVKPGERGVRCPHCGRKLGSRWKIQALTGRTFFFCIRCARIVEMEEPDGRTRTLRAAG